MEKPLKTQIDSTFFVTYYVMLHRLLSKKRLFTFHLWVGQELVSERLKFLDGTGEIAKIQGVKSEFRKFEIYFHDLCGHCFFLIAKTPFQNLI